MSPPRISASSRSATTATRVTETQAPARPAPAAEPAAAAQAADALALPPAAASAAAPRFVRARPKALQEPGHVGASDAATATAASAAPPTMPAAAAEPQAPTVAQIGQALERLITPTTIADVCQEMEARLFPPKGGFGRLKARAKKKLEQAVSAYQRTPRPKNIAAAAAYMQKALENHRQSRRLLEGALLTPEQNRVLRPVLQAPEPAWYLGAWLTLTTRQDLAPAIAERLRAFLDLGLVHAGGNRSMPASHEILPGLYLGDRGAGQEAVERFARDALQGQARGYVVRVDDGDAYDVRSIVRAQAGEGATERETGAAVREVRGRLLHLPQPDGRPSALPDIVAERGNMLRQRFESGEGLLVHCALGMNRSAALAAMLIAEWFGISTDAAQAVIAASRPIGPAPATLEILRDFDTIRTLLDRPSFSPRGMAAASMELGATYGAERPGIVDVAYVLQNLRVAFVMDRVGHNKSEAQVQEMQEFCAEVRRAIRGVLEAHDQIDARNLSRELVAALAAVSGNSEVRSTLTAVVVRAVEGCDRRLGIVIQVGDSTAAVRKADGSVSTLTVPHDTNFGGGQPACVVSYVLLDPDDAIVLVTDGGTDPFAKAPELSRPAPEGAHDDRIDRVGHAMRNLMGEHGDRPVTAGALLQTITERVALNHLLATEPTVEGEQPRERAYRLRGVLQERGTAACLPRADWHDRAEALLAQAPEVEGESPQERQQRIVAALMPETYGADDNAVVVMRGF